MGDLPLFAARTETTNFQYLIYLEALRKQGNREVYQQALPDTLVLRRKLVFGEPYVDYYFRHPAYRDYPVVGVSQEQAKRYCLWLTEKVNAALVDASGSVQQVVVRLPTEQEWMEAARGGLPYHSIFPWPGNELRIMQGKEQGKFKAKFEEREFARTRALPAQVAPRKRYVRTAIEPAKAASYAANGFGLFDMSGNMAEMLAEEGRTKGGSWCTPAHYLRLDAEDFYAGKGEHARADMGIGFRCFMEVLAWKPELWQQNSLTAKMIEQHLVEVNDTLLAGKTEVTNALYQLFLDDLKSSEAEQHQVQHAGWAEVSPYTVWEQYQRWRAAADYPVVNVSHESAVAFCKWLTEKYQHFPQRKYPSIAFSLPTEDEWELAAGGGNRWLPFPWKTGYLTNTAGDYLCNFSPLELHSFSNERRVRTDQEEQQAEVDACRNLDGYRYLAPVSAYQPNALGLYQCAGNAAEMLIEKGISKGGSWQDDGAVLTIEHREQYAGFRADLGFRVFATFTQK